MQGLLELLRIPYTGSGVLASALGMDKYVSRQILAISGIDVPRIGGSKRRNVSGFPPRARPAPSRTTAMPIPTPHARLRMVR